jgi:hypothetical protein
LIRATTDSAQSAQVKVVSSEVFCHNTLSEQGDKEQKRLRASSISTMEGYAALDLEAEEPTG